MVFVVFFVCLSAITSSLSYGGDGGAVLPPNTELNIQALYVFGDSYVDAGNNNFIPTKSRANYFPYGIDLGVPTGRATNGRMVVDFIAQAAGLPFPPPMLGLSKAERIKTLTGVNYGSSGSGILQAPPLAEQLFGHVLSLDEQVALFKNTTMDMKDQFESADSFAFYLSKSLFFIHVASNDLGLFWNVGRHSIDAERYPKLLSEELSKNLQALYQLGARKFFVNNVSPLGCQPFNLDKQKPKTPCFEEMNLRISAYNKLLPDLLADLESKLPESKFILGDLFKLFQEVYASPSSYGFTNVKDSCCIDVNHNGTGLCAPNLEPCPERKTHLFYDPFHISERMHLIWARSSLERLDDPWLVSPSSCNETKETNKAYRFASKFSPFCHRMH